MNTTALKENAKHLSLRKKQEPLKVSGLKNEKNIIKRKLKVPQVILPEALKVLEDNYVSHGICKTDNENKTVSILMIYDLYDKISTGAIKKVKNLSKLYKLNPEQFLLDRIDEFESDVLENIPEENELFGLDEHIKKFRRA